MLASASLVVSAAGMLKVPCMDDNTQHWEGLYYPVSLFSQHLLGAPPWHCYLLPKVSMSTALPMPDTSYDVSRHLALALSDALFPSSNKSLDCLQGCEGLT